MFFSKHVIEFVNRYFTFQMNHLYLLLLVFLSLIITPQPVPVAAWGFQPHRLINRHAVYTLPPSMISFYKHHINYLSSQAVAADHRRYAVAEEGARHYIDLDYYGIDVPRYWVQVIQEFHRDSIQEHGLLPWHLLVVRAGLVQAFKDKDTKNILKISADAGHYLADAHVPLHTTSNYNGQFTNQKGIHGFWETRIPELLLSDFDLWVGKAAYRDDWYQRLWDIILESHQAVDSVLQFEQELTTIYPEDQKYSFEVRLNSITKVYSAEFSRAYHHALNKQVEKRMRSAIKSVGDFWYGCWIEAGQPDLAVKFKKDQAYNPEYQEIADSLWRQQHVLRRSE